MPDLRTSFCLLLVAATSSAFADVKYVVNGLDDTLTANVLSHVDTVQFGPRARLRPRDYDKVIDKAISDARAALRPYGYYAPGIAGQIRETGTGPAVLELSIDPGVPTRVAALELRVEGAGAGESELRAWRRDWPLREGEVLDQTVWEYQKQVAVDACRSRGYLDAAFVRHEIRLDLEQNTADLHLVLETGRRYVMGQTRFSGHELKPGILEYMPRFEPGEPYTAKLVSRLRTDLWKTGYFDDVSVIEAPQPELDPPAVDFDVHVATETHNHYSGALGWGDETGIRLQANYNRIPMSSYGDRLDIGMGYRELDDQFTLRSRYRKPLLGRARHFWDAELTLRFDNLDLEVKRDEEDEDFITLANGNLDERHLRFGRLRLKNLAGGDGQRFITPFVQFLNSDQQFALTAPEPGAPATGITDSDLESRLATEENVLSAGMDFETIDVRGQRFETAGHRDRAWFFHSNSAFGSDVEFTQVYIATRRSFLWRDRVKFHARAEAGFTDADVDEFDIETVSGPLHLSLTRLPNFYRFKAGGSMSVRGYGFEQLSDNDIGSNNIFTASAEVEYRLFEAWSVAAFADIGNAFNDWDDPDLKRGFGLGIRWHSLAGEIRVDVAQAYDFEGRPWRLHLTIGTPLL